MTHAQIADRLRSLAGQQPTCIYRELYALAHELEQTPQPVGDLSGIKIPEEDMEALVRATQPPTRRTSMLSSLNPWRRR